MVGQSQIRWRLSEPETLERLRRLTAQHSSVSRTELAELVGDELGSVDWRGQRQHGGCLKALRVLSRRGRLLLPAARTKPGPSWPRRLDSSVPLPEGVRGQVEKIPALELVPVDSEDLMRKTNSLRIQSLRARLRDYRPASGHARASAGHDLPRENHFQEAEGGR